MKAIVYTEYGAPEVLRLTEVATPVPGTGEVLVRVRATCVNFNNLLSIRGRPLVIRIWSGLLRPKHPTPGNDVAGVVEAVGAGVERRLPGDEVYGDTYGTGGGTFAEYVAVPERVLSPKPASLSFEEAAAVPEAGLVALQSLRDHGKVQAGERVLICGASGGIGTFAVQLAKHFGAKVTAVCGTRNVELVRSLGADAVIDYTREDFVRSGQQYDLILATAGYRWILHYRRALSPGGRYVMAGGKMKQIFQAMMLGPWVSRGDRKLAGMSLKPNKDLDLLTELIEAGRVKPVIDRCYPLSEAALAVGYYGEGHATGKVVIGV